MISNLPNRSNRKQTTPSATTTATSAATTRNDSEQSTVLKPSNQTPPRPTNKPLPAVPIEDNLYSNIDALQAFCDIDGQQQQHQHLQQHFPQHQRQSESKSLIDVRQKVEEVTSKPAFEHHSQLELIG